VTLAPVGQHVAVITNLFVICVHFALSWSISGDRATLLIKKKVSSFTRDTEVLQQSYRLHVHYVEARGYRYINDNYNKLV
jgi:hypothetical protein